MVFLSRAPRWYKNGTNLLHGECESSPSEVGSVNSRGRTARRELLRAESQGLEKAKACRKPAPGDAEQSKVHCVPFWAEKLFGFVVYVGLKGRFKLVALQLHSHRDLHICYLGLSIWFATQWFFFFFLRWLYGLIKYCLFLYFNIHFNF